MLVASLAIIFVTSMVESAIIPSQVDGNKSESNTTISDETMRKVLSSLGDYLDPIQDVPDEGYYSNTTSSYIKAQLNRTKVTDLTNYRVDVAHADMDNLVFEMGLTFPVVNVTGLYNLSVDNNLFRLLGNGSFNINITQCQLATNLTLKLNSNNTLEMKNVSFDFNYGYLHVNFNNLGEDPDVSSLINDFINEFIPDSMESLKPYEQELVKGEVMKLGNFLVMGMTVEDLVKTINNLAQMG